MTTYYDHQCTKCGRLWFTKYEGFYICPGCTRVPRLRGIWLRLKYRLLGKTWGIGKPYSETTWEYGAYLLDVPPIPGASELHAPKVKEAIDATIELGKLVDRVAEQDLRSDSP